MGDDDLLDAGDEDFASSSPAERDWRGIGTALLVIMAICSLIALAVLLFTPLSASKDFRRPVNLSDMHFLQSPLDGYKWADKDTILFRMLGQDVEKLDVNTFRIEKVVDKEIMQPRIRYVPSHDYNYFTLQSAAPNPGLNPDNATQFIEIYSRKSLSAWKIGVRRTNEESQQIFEWNPKNNNYVFVQDGQIYYVQSPEANDSFKITKGQKSMIHGMFDWLYDEEIFQTRKALWWSTSGSLLAFTSRDTAHTSTVRMRAYAKGEPYERDTELAYPKVGEKRLPIYSLSLWDRRTRQSRQMDVQLRDSTAYHYLYGVSWVSLFGAEQLVTVWANRWQNQISITLCEYHLGQCALLFEYKYPERTWSSPEDFKNILHSNDSIYVMLPKQKGDGNIYQHIAKLTIKVDPHNEKKKSAKEAFLSIGNFDVKQMERYVKERDTIYFTATAPDPGQQHLYATSGTPTVDSAACQCVSCIHANCTFHDSLISPEENPQKVLIACRGPAAPHVYIANLHEKNVTNTAPRNTTTGGGKKPQQFYDSDFVEEFSEEARQVQQMTEVLHDQDYHKRVKRTQFPTVVYENVTLSNGFVARVKLQLPAESIAKHATRSFPLFVHVYGGPGSQYVTDEYKIGLEQALVSDQHFAVAEIDGRGSGSRGWKYKSAIYGQLGTVEIEDQVETVKELLAKHTYLDPLRVAVYGWSYGGFAAANMVEEAPGLFRCAVAVAPVSNFIYYDATYTERYMGDAPRSAYDAADLTRNTEAFKHTRLLLMHGLYDDNVHFQNSAIFIEALQKSNVDFDLMVYPNQDHNIFQSRLHLYYKMISFLQRCMA